MVKLKILLLGGNGFTGKFVCKELKKRNIDFHCLIRSGNDTSWLRKNKVNFMIGDINNKDDLTKSLSGCNALINMASLAFVDVESILKCSLQNNIERLIFISSTSIFTKLNAKSKKIRLKSENYITSSNLNWTILRPTMIFGTPEDRNLIKIISWIKKYPIIPIPGDGKALQKPIYVEDLSWAIVESLLEPNTIKKTINISGKDNISYLDMINIIEKKLNKNILKLYISKRFSIAFAELFEFLKLYFPLKAEQIRRINEDKLFSNSDAINIIKYSPKSFEKAIDIEIKIYQRNNQS
tara:strand:+ start:6574 stop:7461 length:888 start_codon:yes stop_codon:yes gene_type:complete